jgi:RNA polymerase sigma-70 factor (ECF subfamily)
VRAIASQSNEFVRLVITYEKLIFTICYRFVNDYFDAEDLAQDTFLSAYKNFETFDGKNEKAWLTKIATNKCLDYLKSKQRLNIPTQDDKLSLYPTSEQAHKPLEDKEIEYMLVQACKRLKEPYSTVAYEYYCLRHPPSQIAREHAVKVKTVQVQIYRAREKLRKELSDYEFN